MTGTLGVALCLAGPAALDRAGAAPADLVHAAAAGGTSCFTGLRPGAADVETRELSSPATGVIRARLTGDGDWDVAVYDQADGHVVAGSAGYRTNELAEGFVSQGQKLIVQTCRFAGSAPTAKLSTEIVESQALLPLTGPVTMALVDVATPTRAAKARLQALDLDLTESGGPGRVRVLTHSARDLQAIAATGLSYTVAVPDLAALDQRNRDADARAADGPPSDLPSGHTGYRRLFDYQLEMKQLARAYPNLVRLLVLPNRTVEGRDVEGIEITTDAQRVDDGKPVFLNVGVHHAREWPSGEMTLEFAYDLLTHRQDKDVARLLRRVRTVVVPVVNPDGFVISREAPAALRLAGVVPNQDYGISDYEYKRKNCQVSAAGAPVVGSAADTCGAAADGAWRGTDINRNYGGFWGGAGASTDPEKESYRGRAPFSEPETRNLRALVSSRQVTVLASNHTFGNLVLRPPGTFGVRPGGDEPLYRDLGARAAASTGYKNIYIHELYDVTGGLEDWSYWSGGTLAFAFESGGADFHPAFADGVVAEYLGRTPAAGAGKGGNRGAFYALLRAAGDARTHGILRGRAPAGVVVRVQRTVASHTSPVQGADGAVLAPIVFRDTFSSAYRSRGGAFAIAVNPSTAPQVGDRYGRAATGPPQAAIPFTNPPPELEQKGLPGDRVPFTIEGPPAVDNGSAVIAISWATPLADWDLYLLDATGAIIRSSATVGTTSESIELLDPRPGRYTALMYDFSGTGALSDWRGGVTFASPEPAVRGSRESWTVTCESRDGRVLATRRVVVGRGQSVDVGNVCR
jgi:hypothetical protein